MFGNMAKKAYSKGVNIHMEARVAFKHYDNGVSSYVEQESEDDGDEESNSDDDESHSNDSFVVKGSEDKNQLMRIINTKVTALRMTIAVAHMPTTVLKIIALRPKWTSVVIIGTWSRMCYISQTESHKDRSCWEQALLYYGPKQC